MALKYSITHNGNTWNSSTDVDSINLSNGSITSSITSAGTRVLHTAGKYAPNNISIGAKILNCSGKIISGDISIVAEDSFSPPSSHTPGDVITWDNKSWLVCHYDSSTNRVYLITKDIISKTKFGSNTKYAGSTLASVAANYQTNNMSAAALNMCVDVTVNSVTAKVFVPSKEQFDGGFSWFKSNTNRKAKYNSSNTDYWTSSPSSSSIVWTINPDGSFGNYYTPSNSYGFRPCVCVQL